MAHNLNQQPPVWAPTAVATEHGWAHPVTGELLVAIKLDQSVFTKPEPTIAPAVEPVIAEASPAPVAKPKPGPKPKVSITK